MIYHILIVYFIVIFYGFWSSSVMAQYYPRYSNQNNMPMFYSNKYDRNADPILSATTTQNPLNLTNNSKPTPVQVQQSQPVQQQLPQQYAFQKQPSNGSDIPKLKGEEFVKYTELQKMVQQLYMAQAQVQLEATEIQRAQTIAASAQQNLEEAANNVRVITAGLRTAQESVASAAIRAQTAQLQLAAHDQLLFTARQKVDALSAQMVGLQAEVGIGGDNKMTVDMQALLNKLKQPLPLDDFPKSVPSLLPANGTEDEQNRMHQIKPNSISWNDYRDYMMSHQQPLNSHHQPNEVLDHLSKRSMSPSNSQNSLSSNDVNDLLELIHNINDKNFVPNSNVKVTENSKDEQNIKDFISNIKNMNFKDSSNVQASVDQQHKITDESSYKRQAETANYFQNGMINYEPRTDEEIINESIRAIDDRNRRTIPS